jgi:hypothetical protein
MADDAITYELKIEGEGLSLSRRIDESLLSGIMHLLLGGSPPSLAPTPFPAHSQTLGSHRRYPTADPSVAKTSLREYITETGAKRNPDKILVIADFLERFEDLQGFGRDDIKGRFRSAGESPPGNFPRDFAWTVSNGWIAEDPNVKGQYYVTRTGHAAIEGRFTTDVTKTSKLRPSRRRRGRSVADGAEQ